MNKNIFHIVAIFAIVLSSLLVVGAIATATGAFVYGDANGDGVVNGQDLLLLRKYLANYDYETGESTIVLGPEGGTPEQPDVPSEPEQPDEPTLNTAVAQDKITDYLKLSGRTYVQNDELKLFWTYSGFSVNIMGTGLDAVLTTTNTGADAIGSLCVYVDGARVPDNTVVLNANGTYTLVEGLDFGAHTIEVHKKNEAIYGGSATIGVKSLAVKNGVFLTDAPKAADLKIAFVGDSITSGFGNMVTDGSGEKFTTPTQDGTMTYATLTARALGADVEITSRSGIAFVRNTDRACFYNYYEKTASLPNNELCNDAWDFDTNGADIIVINLGTNDSGASLNGVRVTDEYMTSEAIAFLRLVRKNNPDALIVWTYGLMGDGRRAAIEAAVKTLNAEGDYDVAYSAMTPQNTGKYGVGVHGHPTVQSLILAAEKLAADIADLIGATVDTSVFLEAQAVCDDAYRLLPAASYEADSYAAYLAARKAAEKALTDGNAAAALTALRNAYVGLVVKEIVKPEDMSSEYIVIDTCDVKGSWSLNGNVSAGMDAQNQIAGDACFTATGGNAQYALNFMHTGDPYNVLMPEDWQNWYLEMWVYVDDLAHMSKSADIEVSEIMDQKEFSYSIPSLDLKAGWNHLQLKLGSARGNPKDMTAIKNIRIFWVNLQGDPLTFKVDDIVLSKTKYAADRTELDELIAKAAAVASPSEALSSALDFAKNANSQRYVDIATERLAAALK